MILTPYIDVAEQMVKTLKGQGCNLIIALTHMMNKSDENLQDKVKGIDLILGGHDHCYFVRKREESIVLKSGSDFESFSILDLEFFDLPSNTVPKQPDFDFFQRAIPKEAQALTKTLQLRKNDSILTVYL